MRALVTGSAGFVGTHVVETLHLHDWDVFTMDLGDDFPADSVDVVVSLAATADPREALRDPAAAYANSTGVMVDTLEYARSVGAQVLHTSTNEAYPPRGPYGGAKACQDIVCNTYRDVDVTTVVTQSLFGEQQQPDKFIPTVIRRLQAEQPIQLQRNDETWAHRPFMHVQNLVDGLMYLTGKQGNPRRVHIGAECLYSLRWVVDILAKELGRVPIIESAPAGDRPGHEVRVHPIGCDVRGWSLPYSLIPSLQGMAHALANPDPAYSAPPRKAA